ncbi:MAG TPA: hypothetical protein PLK34_02860, partial [Candidatus Pacearchaeota archaeon]|nr:hypothetical protein [Candidatus Pacearchaeota archaeon]
MNKKQIQKEKQVLALTQIFTIVISLFAFSYILGDNLKFVSADEPEPPSSCETDLDCGSREDFNNYCGPQKKCITFQGTDKQRIGGIFDERGGTLKPSGKCIFDVECASYLCDETENCAPSLKTESKEGDGQKITLPIPGSQQNSENLIEMWETVQTGKEIYNSVLGKGAEDTLPLLNPDSLGSMTQLRLLESQMGTKFTAEELAAIEKGIKRTESPIGSWITEKLGYQIFGEEAAFGFAEVTVGSILKGAAWAAGAYVAGKKIGEMMGLSEYNSQWLGLSAAVGFFAFQSGISGGIAGWLAESGVTAALGLGSVTMGTLTAGVSIVIGAIIFAVTYREEKYEVYSVTCSPWQAPLGGKECERCNDGDLPCTEYRCKSLGQACELENKGTTEEICVWTSEGDIEYPEITPWNEILTEGYEYSSDTSISPPDKGVRIVSKADSSACVSASTPLKFGVSLNEPGRCKIDSERKDSFEEMSFFIGNSQTLKYNHVQEINLLDLQALRNENTSIYQNEELNLHVRCQDANGNSNTATFVFSFCMEPGPDTTAPQIKATSILNGMPVSQGKTEVN